jgi:plastocyanin
MRLRPFVLAVVVVIVVLGLTGCGGKSSSSSPPASLAATGLSIKNFAFTPNPLAAKVGDVVTVTNGDATDHTVTADDKSFDTGPFQGTKTITLAKAGTVAFHCAIHDYMKGVIQVGA